jgi:hypothetical protein
VEGGESEDGSRVDEYGTRVVLECSEEREVERERDRSMI